MGISCGFTLLHDEAFFGLPLANNVVITCKQLYCLIENMEIC